MDPNILKSVLSKWNEVEDFQRIAFEFFQATNGDARKLSGSFQHEKGAFGQVSNKLFGENVLFHRFLLYNIWISNKGNCRDHFAMVAKEDGQRKNLRSTPYRNESKAKDLICWCSFSKEVTEGRNLPTVNCFKCKKTFHTICAGIIDHDEAIEYTCIMCNNTPSVPELFKQPFREVDRARFKKKVAQQTEQKKKAETPVRFVTRIGKTLFQGKSKKNKSDTPTELAVEDAALNQEDILSLGDDFTGDELFTQTSSSRDLNVFKPKAYDGSEHDDNWLKKHSDSSDESLLSINEKIPLASTAKTGDDWERKADLFQQRTPDLGSQRKAYLQLKPKSKIASMASLSVNPELETSRKMENTMSITKHTKPALSRRDKWTSHGSDTSSERSFSPASECVQALNGPSLHSDPDSENEEVFQLSSTEEEKSETEEKACRNPLNLSNLKAKKSGFKFKKSQHSNFDIFLDSSPSPEKTCSDERKTKFSMRGTTSKNAHVSGSKFQTSGSSEIKDEEDEWQTSGSEVETGKKRKGKKKTHATGKELKGRIDVSDTPTSWKGKFTFEEFQELLHLDPSTGRYSVQPDYGDVLQDKLSEKNEVCVLIANKRKLNQDDEEDKSLPFFSAYTKCKGKHCTAHFGFVVKEVPVDPRSVFVYIKKGKGKICHYYGEQNKRHLKGKRRKLVKEELKHDLPSNVYRVRADKASLSRLRKGNIDETKTPKVFQQAKVEINDEQDFHKNVIDDLFATRKELFNVYDYKRVPGYVQEVGEFPVIIPLYNEQSLKLFRQVSKAERVVLYMDATSNISASIEGFDQKKIFYYAVVVKSKTGKPVPILEFFLSKQDFTSIMYALELFFQKYKRLYNVKSFNFNISRFEIDFSPASLAAACRVFLGRDVEQYLKTVWNALVYKQKLVFTIHICRIHTRKFLEKYFETTYKSSRTWDKVKPHLRAWTYRFVGAKRMLDVCKVLEEILVLVGNEYQTEDVAQILQNDESYKGKYSDSWEDFDINNVNDSGPFYLRTPFGAYFNRMADLISEANIDVIDYQNLAPLPKNVFFSSTMTEYLREHVVPYSALLTKVPFYLNDMPIEGDNTNLVEYWHKIFKNDILHKARYQKITRVIRALSENVAGAVKEALSKFPCEKDEQFMDEKYDFDVKEDNKKQKREGLSPDAVEDKFKTERKSRVNPGRNLLMEMEIIPNGGEYYQTTFSNTCPIDCVLQALYFLYNYTTIGRKFIDAQVSNDRDTERVGNYLSKILSLISIKKYAKAKAIWVRDVLKKDLPDGCMDLWEEERELGMKPLKHWFPFVRRIICTDTTCPSHKMKAKVVNTSYFVPNCQKAFQDMLNLGKSELCNVCKLAAARYHYNMLPNHEYSIFAYSQIGFKRKFGDASQNFAIQDEYPVFPESKLKTSMEIFGKKFHLLCYSLYNGRHYKLVIIDGNRKFLYDGLKSPKKLMVWEEDNSFAVSTLWLTPT